MRNLFPSLLLTATLAVGTASAAPLPSLRSDARLDAQVERALDYLLDNVSMPGASAGSVSAGTSGRAPDYRYHWIRDAALTMSLLVQIWKESPAPRKSQIEAKLIEWLRFERRLQQVPTIGGLGEAKYNLDGTAFNGPWGRPQNDGPALRAITASRIVAQLHSERRDPRTQREALEIIIRDINYLAREYNSPSFDLWEEVKGHHFYTLLTIRTAFLEAAALGTRIGDASLAELARSRVAPVESLLRRHLTPDNRILPTLDRVDGIDYKHSNLDTGVILGLLHTRGPQGNFIGLAHPAVTRTLADLERVFTQIYPLNHRSAVAPGIGRYPEDVYDGVKNTQGNPWFINTHAVAEAHCLAGRRTRGLDFLQRSLRHADQGNGRMSEQFDRHHGFMRGSENLTWSYASFITAVRACRE